MSCRLPVRIASQEEPRPLPQGGESLLPASTICYTQRDGTLDKVAPALKPLGRFFSALTAKAPGRLHDSRKPGLREHYLAQAGLRRRPPLGTSLKRGNGAALSWDCPGIYQRRGKDSNLRGLTPTLQLGHLRKLRLDLTPVHPLPSFRSLLAWRQFCARQTL